MVSVNDVLVLRDEKPRRDDISVFLASEVHFVKTRRGNAFGLPTDEFDMAKRRRDHRTLDSQTRDLSDFKTSCPGMIVPHRSYSDR